MIQVIKAEQRYKKEADWLKAFWLFSFDDYRDISNMGFGNLRVFNDDTFAPGGGFPLHFHREMEIVSIILSGEITHEDSQGNSSVLKAGQIQHMSAGSGIKHSEINHGDKPLEIYQIWLLPNQKELQPGYTNKDLSRMSFKNRLTSIVSQTGANGSLKMNADAEIFLSEIDTGETVSHLMEEGRGLFIYLRSGSVEVNGELLSEGDQARVIDIPSIDFKATSNTQLTVIEVAL